MTEYSFGLLKPDCLKRGIEKEVLSMIGSAGLEIIAIRHVRHVRLTKKEVDIIWAPCAKEYFYNDPVEFSTSGDSVVFILKSESSIF